MHIKICAVLRIFIYYAFNYTTLYCTHIDYITHWSYINIVHWSYINIVHWSYINIAHWFYDINCKAAVYTTLVSSFSAVTQIIKITKDLYCATKCWSKLKGAGHCTSAKCMTSILRQVAEAFPPARQGIILNSHRVIDIATNTSVVLNCALVTYIMMTADVELPNAV